ncbi:MAG: hypothetical protein CMJ44_01205 [Pimelobacter sp.]|nr:hypothetical protein [Pimelobacter sp.]
MRWSGVVTCAAATAALLVQACAAEPAPSAETVPASSSPSPTEEQPATAAEPDAATGRERRTAPRRDPLADAVEGLATGSDEAVLGADISWPQCPRGMGIPERPTQGSPPPVDEARYVVLGLTNGPSFYPNPCLADQVADVRARGRMAAAYAVASYPEPVRLARHGDDGPYDGGTRLGALANTGYAQAQFNLATMADAGLLSPIVWIDVEPVPDFEWSADREANAAVIGGLARGYRDAGLAIGVYSTPYLWDQVVGGLELGVPEWRAAGHTSGAAALATCAPGEDIQGGPAVMGQWVERNRDMNLTCPGVSLELERWFHQY